MREYTRSRVIPAIISAPPRSAPAGLRRDGRLPGPGEQAVGHFAGSFTGAVEREDNQVDGAAAESELVPVHDAGDVLPVAEDIREIQVIVGEVTGWKPQSRAGSSQSRRRAQGAPA